MVDHPQGEICSMKFKASCEHERSRSILSNTAPEGLPAAKEHAIKWFQFESDLLNKRNFGEYSGQQFRFDIEYPSPHIDSATIFAIVTDTKAHAGWANYSGPRDSQPSTN